MHRTTIFIEESTLRGLQRLARRRGMSSAALVREALARYLAEPEPRPGLPSVTGKFSSGASDHSERVDELLWRNPHA